MMRRKIIDPTIGPYDILNYERRLLFQKLNIIVCFVLVFYTCIYFYLSAYFSMIAVASGVVFFSPIIMWLEKNDFYSSSRLIFIFSCCWYIYGASLGFYHQLNAEYYYFCVCILSFLIFDPIYKREIFISLLFPLIAWAMEIVGCDFVNQSLLLRTHLTQYLVPINFTGAIIVSIIFLNYFVKFMFRLKEVAMKEGEDKNRKLQKAHEEIEQKRLALVNASRLSALGEMASAVAHEINNPLAIISATTNHIKKTLVKEKIENKIVDECISDVESTVTRINRIVKGLRVLSRNEVELDLKPSILKDVFDDVFVLCAEKFKNQSIELEIIDPDCILEKEFTCSRVSLAQVFVNLVNNAYDALMSSEMENKWLRIYLKIVNNGLEIRFMDAGPGIDNDLAQKLFEPFFTTKEIGKGTGIGLSISRTIMQAHKGQLYIDHSSPNTCFVILLPII